MYQKWIFHPYSVQRHNQYARFLTCGFIHADYPHLLFNMFTFFFFGSNVEIYFTRFFPAFGKWFFVGLYLVAIVVSVLPTYFKYRDRAYYRSLGASGGVSAIVFASIMFDPTAKLFIIPIPFPIPAFIFAALYLLYSAYQARKASDHINHEAHLYGALFGIVATLVAIPELIFVFIDRVSDFSLF